jgi:small subunit ribosomal protein S16
MEDFSFSGTCCAFAVASGADGATNMVVIRLARGGAKKRPFYNVVVTDSRSRRDGRFIERVGFYNPVAAAHEEGLCIAHDRVDYWRQHGAKLSDTVTMLVARAAQAAKAPAATATPATAAAPAAA